MISAVLGKDFVFKFHKSRVRIARFFYFTILSASIFIPFLSPEIAMSINRNVPLSLWGFPFIALDGSFGFQSLIPQYGCIAFTACFY